MAEAGLVITRGPEESFTIEIEGKREIQVHFVSLKHGQMSVRIEAPKEYRIVRNELYERDRQRK